ncbi:MAG TPA: hypothetical protein VND21_07130, partial [Planctomycetota bacterium]|nr:hypothetical protein [Planctomycetota bacterium]
SSGSAHESLLSRHKDGFDSPIPSGNATTARVLLRLAARTGKPAYAADVGRALSERFEVHAVLAIPAGAALGPRRVGLRLGFQPCDADSCRSPDEALVDLPLRFEVEDAPARHPAVFR